MAVFKLALKGRTIEQITTEEAINRGLVSDGAPVIVFSQFTSYPNKELFDISKENIPENTVAYVVGHSFGGPKRQTVPIQFYKN